MPKAPDSQVATEGISRELVQVQTITAPISSVPDLGVRQRRPGRVAARGPPGFGGVSALLDARLGADVGGSIGDQL